MLKITKDIDYATLLLHHLSKEPSKPQSASAIAKVVPISKAITAKLLKSLTSSGLLISTLGKNGGYVINPKLTSISLYDIVYAVEGRPAIVVCSNAQKICTIAHICQVKQHWQNINNTLIKALQTTIIYKI